MSMRVECETQKQRPFVKAKQPRKTERNYTIGALDIETEPFRFNPDDAPLLLYVTYADEFGKKVSGTSMKTMLEYLLKQEHKKNHRIYIHNLSFDARYIYDTYLSHFCCDYRLRLFQRGGGAFWRIDFVRREDVGKPRAKPALSFFDSMAVYGRSLAEFTKKFAPNCQKIKREKSFDESPFNPNEKSDRDYAMQDVVSLVAAVSAFDDAIFSAFGVHLKGTVSSTGLAACALMLPEGTELWRQNAVVEKRERACYGGGAVLMNFRPYEVIPKVASFDVNSEYPSAMKGEFPASNCVATIVSEYVPEKLGFYRVRVDMPDIALVGLQTKNEKGSVTYRTGKYETFCTGEELAYYAEKHGAKFEVLEGHIYTEAERHFAPFIEHCEKQRKKFQRENRLDMVEVVKLMQNSTYGKFGTKPDDRWEYIIDGHCDPVDEGYDPYFNEETGEFCGIYRRVVNIDEPYMLPAIAALITARGRLLLQKGIDVCGRENVYYCDTDSVKCNLVGADRMRASALYDRETGDYGLFKDEGVSDDMIFVAPKVYGTLDGKTLKAKGIQAAVKRMRENVPGLNILGAVEAGQLEYYSVIGLETYIKKPGRKGTVRKRAASDPYHCVSHEIRSDARYHPICYNG